MHTSAETMTSFSFSLSPYAKTVVSAVGTLVAIGINVALGNGVDAATLGTAIIGLLTTLGVFQVTNSPPRTNLEALLQQADALKETEQTEDPPTPFIPSAMADGPQV